MVTTLDPDPPPVLAALVEAAAAVEAVLALDAPLAAPLLPAAELAGLAELETAELTAAEPVAAGVFVAEELDLELHALIEPRSVASTATVVAVLLLAVKVMARGT